MPARSKLWHLSQFKLFSDLTPPEMAEIDRITVMKRFERFQNIYLSGDPANSIYLLKKGKVRLVYNTYDGQEGVLDILGPGDIFGELALLDDNEPRTEIAQAIEDSYICIVDKPVFERLLLTKPYLNLKITKFMGLRLKTIESKIQNLLFHDAESRVYNLLVQLAKDFGEQHTQGTIINVNLTHQEIGNLVKASRQTVSDCMTQLKKKGWIASEKTKFILLRNGKEGYQTGA